MRRSLVWLLIVVISACTAAPADDASGQEIYGQLCASCHSRDLSGGVGPPLGPGSPAVELPDDLMAATIRQGKGSRMPAFSRTLSDSQIDRLVEFIRERQAG